MARKLLMLGTTAARAIAVAGVGLNASPSAAQETAEVARESVQPGQQEVANPSLPTPSATAVPDEGESIVVTGSRLRRGEFNSPTPIQVIDPELALRQGLADTASIIQSSSIAAGSSQLTSTISSNLVSSPGGRGAATVSLRGLGANRTLVLLNGRRAGPAGTRGEVSAFDLNVLPSSVISSVEIVKTGASSIYGSDAIAGVVNILTRRNTNGLQLDAFSSLPFEGGGEELRGAVTYGRNFDRGHFIVTLDYYRQNELRREQREYLDCPEEYIFRRSGERADIVDPRSGSFRCEDSLWGHIWLYGDQLESGSTSNVVAPNGAPIRRLQFDYDGSLAQFTPPLSASEPQHLRPPPGWFPTGYDRASKAVENAMHPFISGSSMIPRTERLTLYADASFKLTDDIEWYGEFLRNRRDTYQNGFRIFYQYITFTEEFPVQGSPFGDPFSVRFSGGSLLSPTAITDHNDTSQRIDYTRGVSGFRGEFGDWLGDWSWDAHVQYSRSNGRYTTDQIFNDALVSQDLRTGPCAGTLPVRGVPCMDINFVNPAFLAGNLTQAERAFLFGTETGRTIYTQLFGEASATGTLFDLPAGPIQAAFGVTWRRDRINDTPGEITLARNAWLASASGVTAGKSVTQEAFAEVQIPLIHDTPLIKSLTLSGSARLTGVEATRASDGASSRDDGNWTYSAGANWEVTDWLRFRGSYGTSFRAPALFEQFLADQTDFRTQRNIDPCINWGANLAAGSISQRLADNCEADGIPAGFGQGALEAEITTGGGLGVLEAETSTALTASVILTPRFGFLPNTTFNLAVDYFDIRVKGEIAQLTPNQVVRGCYDSEFFPDDPLCDLFVRSAEPGLNFNTILTVRNAFVNINSQRNRGIDVTANVRHDLGRWGSLSLRTQMTWQIEDTIALFAGTEIDNNGEAGEPKWVGDFNLSWVRGGTTIFYGLDVVGATSNEADYIESQGSLCRTTVVYGEFCVDVTAPARFYHSASITQRITDRIEITAGVSNLFNTPPPRVTISGGVLNNGVVTTIGQSLFASQYDYAGRRAFINVRSRF